MIKRELEPYFSDVGASIELHGSIEKGTALRGDLDIDIFVLVPRELGKEWIRREFLERARRALSRYDPEERYAEHPYLRIRVYGKYEADVVPGLRIEDPRESVTVVDRTPFHTRFIKKSLDERGRDEVRLLKRFMKGVGVYGAEVRVGGFSGYLTELLIVKYGSFLRVLEEAAQKWRRTVVVSLTEEDPRNLRRMFPDSVFIFPDPVDSRRNAAAAVRPETLYRFVLASRMFLERPSEDYFFPGTPPLEMIRERLEERCFIATELELLRRDSPDNIWGQLNRIKRRVYNSLESEGYGPLYVDVYWDEKTRPLVYIEIHRDYCRDGHHYIVVEGPPVYSAETRRFVEKQLGLGEGVWIVGERLYGTRKKSLDDVVKKVFEKTSLENIRCSQELLDREKLLSRDTSPEYLTWLGETVLRVPRFLFHLLREERPGQ